MVCFTFSSFFNSLKKNNLNSKQNLGFFLDTLVNRVLETYNQPEKLSRNKWSAVILTNISTTFKGRQYLCFQDQERFEKFWTVCLFDWFRNLEIKNVRISEGFFFFFFLFFELFSQKIFFFQPSFTC